MDEIRVVDDHVKLYCVDWFVMDTRFYWISSITTACRACATDRDMESTYFSKLADEFKAPEHVQASKLMKTGAANDVYSFGYVIFYMPRFASMDI